ncbi:GSCOCG00012183001-RA-CDS [Cotesia congregata]|nr:GSCOCG00012183001-RA-CDS [Cotesia congregata]
MIRCSATPVYIAVSVGSGDKISSAIGPRAPTTPSTVFGLARIFAAHHGFRAAWPASSDFLFPRSLVHAHLYGASRFPSCLLGGNHQVLTGDWHFCLTETGKFT